MFNVCKNIILFYLFCFRFNYFS